MGITIDAYLRFLKVRVIRLVYIHKFLRITISERKPQTLYLYHNAMSLQKSMRHIGKFPFHPFAMIKYTKSGNFKKG